MDSTLYDCGGCCYCCPRPLRPFNTAYAQFGASSNGPSRSDVSYLLLSESGGLARASAPDVLTFERGYIYQVSYTFLATPEEGQYYQILPFVNGEARLLYSTVASACGGRNASAAGSFLVTETAEGPAELTLRLSYGPLTNNIDLTGVVTVVPVASA
ncbi:hypothetical protein KQI82_11730 [Oscillibacter sp. MSJ-2]|uniref:Uncharacterized protein n=1 Tax=Dysosmobacter acutus TaxID=2841504 RepID=A0ABS6FDZ6_9FIRM|nr:hypothetical protein [Dysosmobacter acutus]MBU5627580.1 hypothetical protein [Dysosmobacter acutus]